MALEFLTSGQVGHVCRRVDGSPLSGVTLHDWILAGIVECQIGGQGTGDQRRFNLVQSLQAVVFGALQAAGYSRGQSLAAVKVLHGRDRAWLPREFADRRHYIAVSGGQAICRVVMASLSCVASTNRAHSVRRRSGRPRPCPLRFHLPPRRAAGPSPPAGGSSRPATSPWPRSARR